MNFAIDRDKPKVYSAKEQRDVPNVQDSSSWHKNWHFHLGKLPALLGLSKLPLVFPVWLFVLFFQFAVFALSSFQLV